jgi:hypothetical protein
MQVATLTNLWAVQLPLNPPFYSGVLQRHCSDIRTAAFRKSQYRVMVRQLRFSTLVGMARDSFVWLHILNTTKV